MQEAFAEGRSEEEITNGDEVVLWLWELHQQYNSMIEDPFVFLDASKVKDATPQQLVGKLRVRNFLTATIIPTASCNFLKAQSLIAIIERSLVGIVIHSSYPYFRVILKCRFDSVIVIEYYELINFDAINCSGSGANFWREPSSNSSAPPARQRSSSARKRNPTRSSRSTFPTSCSSRSSGCSRSTTSSRWFRCVGGGTGWQATRRCGGRCSPAGGA
jgi:hypothetical protein